MIRQWKFLAIFLFLVNFSNAQAETNKETLMKLKSCPDRPSCVMSKSTKDTHKIDPLVVKRENPIEAIATVVTKMPRVKVIKKTEKYLHVTFQSKIFGFIDDVEFLVSEDKNVVDVRSCSRVGYYDFGVNRKRIETIREVLLNDI